MAKLLPPVKSSIIKPKSSSLMKDEKPTLKIDSYTKKTKIINPKKLLPPSQLPIQPAGKLATQTKKTDLSEDILIQIEKKVIKIDKLLKDSLILQKKDAESKRKKKEKGEFDEKEKELESKKLPKVKGLKLPTPPKLGILDWIKNFIFNTLLGFIAIRLVDHLPKLLNILPVIIKAGDFIIDFGGKLLDGLVTFIDWGYKAYDATRGFVKNIFGEGGAKKFDELSNVLNQFLNLAIIAGMATAGAGGGGGGRGGANARRGFDTKGRRVGVDVQRRYAQRFGRDKFIDRFGKGNLKNLQGGARRGAFQRGARNAFVGLAGKGGAKSILKFIRPLTKRIPIIGGLLDFGLSVALGEDPGRAAFKAIGATLVGAVGAAIGTLAFGAGSIVGGIIGSIGGDMLGGALYDVLFKNKKPKQGKTNKLAGGGRPTVKGGRRPVTRTLKKKKKARTISFTPTKIKPGRNAGGEDKVQKVFPNPKKRWWDPFGLFSGGANEQQPQQKPKEKTANPQEFLVNSNDVLGKADFFGPFFTLALKTVLGDKPGKLDYLNIGKGLNAWMQTAFKTGPLGFAGGGEVDAKQFFEGEDYTSVVAKSVEESVSKEVNTTIRDLAKELALRPVGKEEMLQENRERAAGSSSEPENLETAGGAVAASQLYKEIGANAEQWDIFRNSIALIESGGRYGVPGGSGKHYDGRYQMGEAAKKDGSKVAGVPYPGHSSDPNAHVRVSFRNNPQLQETIFTGFTIANHRYLMRNPKYKSASVERKLEILGYAHNQGMGGAENWMNTGKVGADGFGTKGTKYTDLIAKNFRAKRSGGKMELAQGAVGVPSHPGLEPEIKGSVGSFGVMDPTPRSKPGVRGSSGYAADSGLDIIGKTGDAIVAPVSGTLLYAERGHTSWSDDSDPGKSGYQPQHSFLIQLSKPFKYANKTVKYAYGTHLSSLSNSVANKSGVPIKAGQTIGGMGVANKVPHLHLGLLQNRAQSSESDWLSNTQVKSVLTGSRFGGGPVLKTGNLFAHKGEYVIDKDSVDLFGIDIIDSINRIENRAQLVAKAPSIIEKLKSISGYTDYEQPYAEPQVVIIEKEVSVPMPMGGGGSSIIAAGGGIDNSDYETLEML